MPPDQTKTYLKLPKPWILTRVFNICIYPAKNKSDHSAEISVRSRASGSLRETQKQHTAILRPELFSLWAGGAERGRNTPTELHDWCEREGRVDVGLNCVQFNGPWHEYWMFGISWLACVGDLTLTTNQNPLTYNKIKKRDHRDLLLMHSTRWTHDSVTFHVCNVKLKWI